MNLPTWLEYSLIRHLANQSSLKPNPEDLELIKNWSQSSYFKPRYTSPKVTFTYLWQQSQRWARQNQSQEWESRQDCLPIIQSNFFTWVLLRSQKAYDRESQLMRHCVKDYFLSSQDTEIYSLRDKNNNPKITIEVKSISLHDKKTKYIIQISSKANQLVPKKYRIHLKNFLTHFHHITWAIPNQSVYLAHELVYHYPSHSAIAFSELNYFSGNLDLMQFNGIMPQTLTVDGNLNLTKAQPQVLSGKLQILGNLIVAQDFVVPESWSFFKLTRLNTN